MRITAIVGSYHKGGMVDTAVDEMLDVARARGAEVEKIYLLDQRIEFCRNCQTCTQEADAIRGACPIDDDMRGILDKIDASEGLVLASPMNFFTVTALMKCFIERLVCYAYWPWGKHIPKERIERKSKRAIVVVSCAAPSLIGRLGSGMHKLLKRTAKLLGAGRVETLFMGSSRHTPDGVLSDRYRKRARKMACRLVCQTRVR